MAEKQTFSDAIRQAVNDSGMSRYAICKQLGIDQALLSRFMSGAWLGQPTMNALAQLLGMTVTVAQKGKSKKGYSSPS